ncbi:unnamed protein product [Tilletia controversa]|nr:unnamed protein product [Tilletia controversa]
MSLPEGPPLRHCPPYWHVYETSCKRRWYDRELLEMLVTEFRDRTKEYYHWAIHTGLCQVNHQKTDPRYCLKNGDTMRQVPFAHEQECQTIFKRISYDPDSDTSVVYCRPITGRTHQIRVHAQYLGYPIPNDPLYNHPIWEQYPATCFKQLEIEPDRWKTEAGGMTGNQAVDAVIAAIKLERDSKEDWARWRDEMLFSHLMRKEGVEVVQVPGANGQSVMDDPKYLLAGCPAGVGSGGPELGEEGAAAALEGKAAFDSGMGSFCEECRIPLHPDPKPSELYIYLHALKYETDEWSYEDEMPWWAKEDWREGRAEE